MPLCVPHPILGYTKERSYAEATAQTKAALGRCDFPPQRLNSEAPLQKQPN